MRNKSIILLGLLTLAACEEKNGHGHAHDAAGEGHVHGDELRVDTTIWTSNLELFVEYPVFVVGQPSRFAAHFTYLEGHQPVKEGVVTASLIKDGKGIRHTVESASSPGIFTPALQPEEAGQFQLLFELKAPGFYERIDAGMVSVYPDDKAASEAQSQRPAHEPEISFLKEQAWKIDFQTIAVKTDTIYGMMKLAGKWMPQPGTQRTLNAGTSGNVLFETPGLVEGIAVKKGQVLMRISGENMNVSSIESEIRKAKAEYEQAESEYQRKKELNTLQVVPEAELEQSELQYKVAETNYQRLIKNYGANGVAVHAPFNGYIKQVSVENGAYADAGQPLLTVGSELAGMIKANAPPDHRFHIIQTRKVWIMEDGNLLPVNGKVVSVGRDVTQNEPMVPVFIEVKTPIAAVQGSLAEVQLGYTNGKTGLVIPKEALLEDYGNYKVIVQTGGEAFEMRPVTVGEFNGNQVEIIKGLEESEWVVAKGAYQVKMASMTGAAPGHGHAH